MSETSISLFDCFSSLPDPRAASGKRHPLGANRAAQLRTFCANPVKALQEVHRKITEN